MDWQDQDAPIILGDLEEKRIPLIAAFILENFRKFSPKMADFAQMAFEKVGLKLKIVQANVLGLLYRIT